MYRSLIARCYCFLLISAPAYAQTDTILDTEYEALLTVGELQYRSRNTIRALDGQVIPIELQKYKVEIKVSSLDEEEFKVDTTIFEKSNETWVEMDVDSGGFGGRMGFLNVYDWNGEDIRLSITITTTRAAL